MTCLCHELSLLNLQFERQKAIPISYKGIVLDAGYRLDLDVEGQVIVEIKAVAQLLPSDSVVIYATTPLDVTISFCAF